jgi:hypothetical protein
VKVAAVRFWLPLAVLAVVNVFCQQYYVERSRAVRAGTFAQLPLVSSRHAASFYAARRGTWTDTVFTDEFNRGAAHIQGYYVNPSRIIFLASDFYDGFGPTERYCTHTTCRFAAPRQLFAATDARMAQRERFFRRLDFRFSPGTADPVADHIFYDDRARDARLGAGTQIIASLQTSVVNRRADAGATEMYGVGAPSQFADRLVLVPGPLGTALSAATRGEVTLFPLEPDPFLRGESFSAIGRYLLFRVLAPSTHPRLEVSVSTSAMGAGNRLPPAAVVGDARIALPLVGRGSARVFSDVVVPQTVGGMRFVGLDMGADAEPLPEPPRRNLMRLYGRGVPLESRKITAFARDISLVDDREYGRLTAPQQVERFPDDLANPNLEFSGVYEDGWASEESYLMLRAATNSPTLRVRGVVPLIDDPYFSARACVLLDRLELGCRKVHVAPFDFAYPLGTLNGGNHEVRITFDRYQRLPGGDGRPVGMKLNFVGFAAR